MKFSRNMAYSVFAWIFFVAYFILICFVLGTVGGAGRVIGTRTIASLVFCSVKTLVLFLCGLWSCQLIRRYDTLARYSTVVVKQMAGGPVTAAASATVDLSATAADNV